MLQKLGGSKPNVPGGHMVVVIRAVMEMIIKYKRHLMVIDSQEPGEMQDLLTGVTLWLSLATMFRV